MISVVLAGCAGSSEKAPSAGGPDEAAPPFLDYVPVEPDLDLPIVMEDVWFAGAGGTQIHARIVRPDIGEAVPVIAQFTPYTAPGCNVGIAGLEPSVTCSEGTFDMQFVRRGYAFAYGDVRGTGDSSGCLDLRGQLDIQDIGFFADFLGEQSWSNGNVGFIGASYPGSEAHMAAMSGSEHVKAVVPIVASTSFYHYHHNDGVPYNGNHALGGTNTGYTSNAVSPTVNPQSPNYATRVAEEAQCPTHENVLVHGGLDQTGDYYDWWQDRNLRAGAAAVTVPVLMGQGLADWNVKPDHIATWFNDLNSSSKTFIGGQWGHAYPATDDSACPADYAGDGCLAPWGNWWAYATAFFDTFLKEVDTGMFQGSVAWVQDNGGTWHRSTTFPLQGVEARSLTLHLNNGHQPALGLASAPEETLSWHACPRDQNNMGHAVLAAIEGATVSCTNSELVFESEAFDTDILLSGVPLLNLTIDTQGKATHIVAVIDIIDEAGNIVRSRENYGYLNTRFWQGFPEDAAVPTGFYATTLDFYPQEDLLEAGDRIRLTLRSHDDGRSIEAFTEGDITVKVGGPDGATLTLPARAPGATGVRLATPAA